MTRQEYVKTKKYIKSLCKNELEDLCEKININEYDKNILLCLNRNDTRISISMEIGSCECKISKDTRRILTKIWNYNKRVNLF